MSKYLKFIKIDLIIIAVLAVLFGISFAVKGAGGEYAARTNDKCTNTERVFDYADKLSDEEENQLRARIAQMEPVIQADVLIVTLDEPMSDNEVMVYSDDFQDQEGFGYNKPYGNCAMLVDNWDSSNTYMWFHTAGNVYDHYSEDMIDSLISDTCEYDNESPYKAYNIYLDSVYQEMRPVSLRTDLGTQSMVVFVIALVAMGIFLFINLFHVGARDTTVATTYMRNHAYKEIEKSDIFLSKHTTSHKIETSSGSGGGGGSHTSGGGNTYGGGGGHH